jgi:hypothetical protein
MVTNTLMQQSYHADTGLRSNRWVTDTALHLIDHYQPQFIILSYAQQYFATRFTCHTVSGRAKLYDAVFDEVARFIEQSGFVPIVVGTGDMMPLVGTIDLSGLDGLAIVDKWSNRYAGLYGISKKDINDLKNIAQVERIVDREEFISLFNGETGDAARLPDYLAVAREGYNFKSHSRQPIMIPACNEFIPVSTIMGNVQSITEFGNLIHANFENIRMALILIEGVGIKNFQLPCKPCANGIGWYCYEPGEAQYLAITKGKHHLFTYPTDYKYDSADDEIKGYPFAGYFNTIHDNTLGNRGGGRSIVVGNRGMATQSTTGNTIDGKWLAWNLYNQGCMTEIHKKNED